MIDALLERQRGYRDMIQFCERYGHARALRYALALAVQARSRMTLQIWNL